MQPWASLGWEDPLEKEMAIHSSILAWKIPWMVELVRVTGRLGSAACLRGWEGSDQPLGRRIKGLQESALSRSWQRESLGSKGRAATGLSHTGYLNSQT